MSKDPSERTYEERWYVWQYKRMTAPPNTPYDVGEEREFFDGNALANNEIKSGFGNDFPKWFREAGKHFGQKCKVSCDDKIYTLIGMSETFEDYYYIVVDENGKKHYHTGVGKIEFV